MVSYGRTVAWSHGVQHKMHLYMYNYSFMGDDIRVVRWFKKIIRREKKHIFIIAHSIRRVYYKVCASYNENTIGPCTVCEIHTSTSATHTNSIFIKKPVVILQHNCFFIFILKYHRDGNSVAGGLGWPWYYSISTKQIQHVWCAIINSIINNQFFFASEFSIENRCNRTRNFTAINDKYNELFFFIFSRPVAIIFWSDSMWF